MTETVLTHKVNKVDYNSTHVCTQGMIELGKRYQGNPIFPISLQHKTRQKSSLMWFPPNLITPSTE